MQGLIRSISLSLPILGSMFLLSCATLSKQQCLIGDWQTIGYNDGVAGYSSERLASHSKACAKAHVTPDYLAWERGRKLGLQQYCTSNNAYNVGRRGRRLNNVCPAAMVNRLQQANQHGLAYYRLDNQLDTDRRLLDEYQTEFDQLESGAMLDFANEKDARKRLLFLADELGSIKRRLDDTQRQLDMLNHTSKY